MPSMTNRGSLDWALLTDEMARITTWLAELGEPPAIDTLTPETLPWRVLTKLDDWPAVTSSLLSSCTPKLSLALAWLWPMAVTTTSPRTSTLGSSLTLISVRLPTFSVTVLQPMNENCRTALSPGTLIEYFPSMSVATPPLTPLTVTETPIAGSSNSSVTVPVTTRACTSIAMKENNSRSSCFFIIAFV